MWVFFECNWESQLVLKATCSTSIPCKGAKKRQSVALSFCFDHGMAKLQRNMAFYFYSRFFLLWAFWSIQTSSMSARQSTDMTWDTRDVSRIICNSSLKLQLVSALFPKPKEIQVKSWIGILSHLPLAFFPAFPIFAWIEYIIHTFLSWSGIRTQKNWILIRTCDVHPSIIGTRVSFLSLLCTDHLQCPIMEGRAVAGCPICGKDFPIAQIDAHVEECLEYSEKTQTVEADLEEADRTFALRLLAEEEARRKREEEENQRCTSSLPVFEVWVLPQVVIGIIGAREDAASGSDAVHV